MINFAYLIKYPAENFKIILTRYISTLIAIRDCTRTRDKVKGSKKQLAPFSSLIFALFIGNQAVHNFACSQRHLSKG